MSILNSKTEKWYESRLLWLGIMEVAASAASAYFGGVEASVWVRPDGKMEILADYPYDLVLPMNNWKK